MKVLYKTLLFAVVLMAGFLILSTTAQSKQKVSGPILSSYTGCRIAWPRHCCYHKLLKYIAIENAGCQTNLNLLFYYSLDSRCRKRYKT